MKRIFALFTCFFWLSISATWANAEDLELDLRDALKSGQVSVFEVIGSGVLGPASLGAVLRNDSTDHLTINTSIERPLYFLNETSKARDSLIATELYLPGGEYFYFEDDPSFRFIELPPKSSLTVEFVAYSADLEKEGNQEEDAYSLADTPQDIELIAARISAFAAENPDHYTTESAQVALWRAQGRSLDEIRPIFPFSEEDRKIGNEILEGVPIQPSTIYFRWEPNTFWCGDWCVVDELSFAEAYPVPFYQTDAFVYTVIATSVATAATVTFMTAGAGAPALAPGTSWLVVLAGGGGQGAYMSGLSTIGSVIGSNAIGGAAIVNSFGATVGLTAGARSAAFGGVALKTMFGVSAAAYDGILIAENKKGELLFVTELSLPTELGSGWVRELVENVYESEQKAAEALDAGNKDEFDRSRRDRQDYLLQGVIALKNCWPSKLKCWQQRLSRDDLITLSIMAYKAGKFDLFHRVIEYVSKRKAEVDGSTAFLDYLYATSLMMQSNFNDAPRLLKSAIDQEPGVIEPTLLYIAYLGETDFEGSKRHIEYLLDKLEKTYDDDDYQTAYSLATAYFRVGHIYASHDYYDKAILHFGQAKDELNYLQKWPIFSGFMNQKFRQDIELDIAIAHFRAGKEAKARRLYEELEKEFKSDVEKKALARKYLCSTTPEKAKDKCKPAAGDAG